MHGSRHRYVQSVTDYGKNSYLIVIIKHEPLSRPKTISDVVKISPTVILIHSSVQYPVITSVEKKWGTENAGQALLHFTTLSMPEYKPDNRSITLSGIPLNSRSFQSDL